MWGDRSGREPTRAKSPLRLRRGLSIVGLVSGVVGLVVVGANGWSPTWATVGFTAVVLASLVGLLVISRRLR